MRRAAAISGLESNQILNELRVGNVLSLPLKIMIMIKEPLELDHRL